MWRSARGDRYWLLRVCLAFAGSIMAVAAASAGQPVPLNEPLTAARDAQAEVVAGQFASPVARLLAERHAFIEIPRKGKVTRKIALKDETYAMPDGPSRVVLLKLPEYRQPYALTLKSFVVRRVISLTETIFVPTTVLMDADFVVTRTVSETELLPKGLSVEATIPFTAPHTGERFVLVYTQARAVGQRLTREWEPNLGLSLETDIGSAIGQALTRRQRSGHGTIQVQTKPGK